MCKQYKKKVNNSASARISRYQNQREDPKSALPESPGTERLQSSQKRTLVNNVTMGVIWAAILVIAATSRAAPAIRYDQRQEGDVNVRADLENFVVLIIPTSGSHSSPNPAASPSTLGLFDLLSKAVPAKNHPKKSHDTKKVHHAPMDTAQFLESKTAPYHVDISRARDHQKEILIAESPNVNLGQARDMPLLRLAGNPAEYSRRSKTLSIELPAVVNDQKNEVKAIVVIPEEVAMGNVQLEVTRSENPEVPQKTEPRETLTLLGAQLEQCGPGQKRDSNGICQASS